MKMVGKPIGKQEYVLDTITIRNHAVASAVLKGLLDEGFNVNIKPGGPSGEQPDIFTIYERL